MAIAPIKLIDITSNRKNLDNVLTRFIDLKGFHPVLASEIIDRVHGLTSFVADNPCQPLLQELAEIDKKYNLNLPDIEQREIDDDFSEMSEYILEIKESLEHEVDLIKALEKDILKYEDALVHVKNIQSLEIPLDDLFDCSYIYIRFGRLPNDSVEKLRFFRNKPFVFKSFNYDQNYNWCLYFTTEEYKREVDNIFSSLFFERIFIPDFVHGTPTEAIASLEAQIKSSKKQIEGYRNDIYDISCGCADKLSCIKGELLFLNRVFEAKKYVVGLGDRFTISGFTDERNVENVKSMFDDLEDVEIEVGDADSDKRIAPPTKLKNGWFSRPFSMFVEMYGLPAYGEIDPTPFVAITYALLFGIMFGDVGQGFVLAVLGFLLHKYKGMRLGAVGVRIGLSSMVFGLIYGSVFGNEELLTPFYTDVLGFAEKPVHVMDADFTMTLLVAAIAFGALLIVISMIMNITGLLRKKRYVEAATSHNGLAGLMFYGYLLAGLGLSLGTGQNIFTTPLLVLFAGIPLILVFLKEPLERLSHKHKMFPAGIGGFFVEGFFELFEIVLSYVTNTMSFLRVGGFVLSHAGMMLVVMSLMEMSSGSGILVLALGNVFVMVLEGMIVGIQVLRLEFYEMFSRYYEGNGTPFIALNK
jgi:V/A-type H+/Na+-transporting ATPase subunit I